MILFTKIALASTGMIEIKRNQAGFILYIQGRANPPRLERFVTFWSFPRWSNILHPLTGGRRNRLTICQIRYKETNSETVTLSTPALRLAFTCTSFQQSRGGEQSFVTSVSRCKCQYQCQEK